MTDESWEMMLAEHLGGELDAEATKRLEARLAANPALAERVATLRAARDAVAAGLPALRQADERAASAAFDLRAVVAGRRRRGWTAVARYAAVIVVGFLAGYFARGAAFRSERANSQTAVTPATTVSWAQRYVEAVRSRPGASDYAHALLAVARR
ncbi:MAG: hypothetical protein D6744_04715 [Planctomycetota bacterium]|nr:MAG: hypothetical protein D6744_04715 [Planctomycetota bacterium]